MATEVGEALEEYYKEVERLRASYRHTEIEGENRVARNAMIWHLLRVLPDDAAVIDVLSGDCVVPLAIEFLQKHFPEEVRKMGRLTVLDDNEMDGLTLARKYAERFGLRMPEMLAADAVRDDWHIGREGRYDTATVIDAMNKEYMPAPSLVLPKLAKVAPRLEVMQVNPIACSYMDELWDAGYGDVDIRDNDAIYVVRARVLQPTHSR